MLSSVPVFVIWLSDAEENGTGRGHSRQTANPAPASSASTTSAIGSAPDSSRDEEHGGHRRPAAALTLQSSQVSA